ncbi:dicarboxylate/amino acid:cation symporter [Polynucleobacter sp.]|jgi:Na+/H+-dicarboxylate symporter|uniref:dicarboxylate/amino acid:cation symporter n=1 Tax=Polynucleobacter sp. TaxID=2029855 RepID=UPI0037C98278
MNSKKLTNFIFFALLLGVAVGYLVNANGSDSGFAAKYASYAAILTDIFMRLIKMIIAPLVFSTLVVGMARMGGAAEIGRVGFKTFGWFILMSTLSLLMGLLLVNFFQPGVASGLVLPDAGAAVSLNKSSLNLADFVRHAFPASIMDAMAKNEVLQIVVFSLFFGVAAAGFGDRAQELVRNLDMLSHIMLKITSAVMKFAPIAVFAAVSVVIAKNGLSILLVYGKFMLSFYAAILVLWFVIILAGFAVLRTKVFRLVSMLRQPLLLSFTTASSEAAYPVTLEQVERFGCKNKIASFVLPMGYSFNLDGSMMYCTFAAVFIAQVYGIDMPLSEQLLMLLVLMVTSKGIAGVPRASLVVIAATLSQFDLPEAGILLILGIDHFLDMARSATNVLGNGVATAVISKWEGELKA